MKTSYGNGCCVESKEAAQPPLLWLSPPPAPAWGYWSRGLFMPTSSPGFELGRLLHPLAPGIPELCLFAPDDEPSPESCCELALLFPRCASAAAGCRVEDRESRISLTLRHILSRASSSGPSNLQGRNFVLSLKALMVCLVVRPVIHRQWEALKKTRTILYKRMCARLRIGQDEKTVLGLY